jgi:V8-like Glu-specific endopeptidase
MSSDLFQSEDGTAMLDTMELDEFDALEGGDLEESLEAAALEPGTETEDIALELEAGGPGLEPEFDEFELPATMDPFGAELDPYADYQIIGADTRKRITNTRRIPFRWICKLDPPGCTGTLIAPNKVLTAAHCVYNRATKKPYRGIRVIPGKNGPGRGRSDEPYGSIHARRLQLLRAYADAPTYGAAWPHDYAVITLRKSFPADPGFFPSIRIIPPKRLARLRLNTAGYPGDKGGAHMWWTFNTVVSVNGARVEYLHDTIGGQSGSPVWVRWKNDRSIVAVHVARDDLGTPGASPVVANRGVAMTPTVLANIRRWMR